MLRGNYTYTYNHCAPLLADLFISLFVPTNTYVILGYLTKNGKKLAKSLGLQQTKVTLWMQELPIIPRHLRSQPFFVGFVLCNRLFLGSVLWIMVWPFVPFILAILFSVLDFFNAFMFQKYCFSLICRDYHHFNLILCCTVQWWYVLSLKITILVLPIVVLLNGWTLSNVVFLYPYVMIILPY